MKEKEEAEENKCNNFYISDSIGKARMVQQFRIRGVGSEESDQRSTVLCIRVGIDIVIEITEIPTIIALVVIIQMVKELQ